MARIALVGVIAVLGVAAGGRIYERAVLGPDDNSARARIAQDVRGAFDVMSRGLQVMARRSTDSSTLIAVAAGDDAAAKRLFAQVQAAGVAYTPDVELALTVYAAGGRPEAWTGRPSDLPADRLDGDEAWFITQGALGLRLAYVVPVTDASGTRIGTIAAEQSIRPPVGAEERGADLFEFPGQLAPVALELAFEDVRATADPDRIDVAGPNGRHLVTAVVNPADVSGARARWRRTTASLTALTAAVFVLLCCGPLLDWRDWPTTRGRVARQFGVATAAVVSAVAIGRTLILYSAISTWSAADLFSAATYASPRARPLLGSPFDFLLTAAAAGAFVALAGAVVEGARGRWRARWETDSPLRMGGFVLAQLVAGSVLAALLVAYRALLADTVAHTSLDLLHYSLHPWNAALLALQTGLVLWGAAAAGAATLVLRGASLGWRIARGEWRVRLLSVTCWSLPFVVGLNGGPAAVTARSLTGLLILAIGASLFATRLKGHYRQASQAFRLTLLAAGLILPALASYPAIFGLARQAKVELVETRYGPQVLNQRQTIQMLMQQSLREIDGFPGLTDLVSIPPGPPGSEALTNRSFQVWRVTGLAAYPVTSSVELFGPDGRLVSRFAFNLPDDLNAVPTSEERVCTWDVFEEVSPFFAVERRILSASRAVCVDDPSGTRVVGSVVVHALLDYDNLPFIASKSPYVELLRPIEPQPEEGVSGQDIEFAVYGWSRTPLYSSGDTSWELTDATFAVIADVRAPVWATLLRGGQPFDVYLLNDRGGVYALGFPVVTALGHLMNLAELTVLAGVSCLTLLILTTAFGSLARRTTSARALLQEVRASFYRKLFLAFAAATSVPVIALAVVSTRYVGDQMRANVEQEAVRTAAAAQRVVEDLVAPRAARQGIGIDDNLMVWVSRLIDQDVNIYSGPRLLATSERNLFASGVLPLRTPAGVYGSLELQHEATTVSHESIGGFDFLVAGTRMTAPPLDATLTIPLTSRAKDIEAEIDALDRRVLLATLLFILAGAGIGYSMAERIADPVRRLTRATRRVAHGDLDARVIATTADELGRLVEDFNRMAQDLAGQREQLERTNRLEAWAEMARQVAHEIKNPLTPIQLNAEHLRRVNADRGEPLSPILEQSVSAILSQVKLLRQIASEFSSFASSPAVHPSQVDLSELLREIVDPYRSAVAGQIAFDVNVPPSLPPVQVDRTLIARALTNLIENALHAMGSSGSLSIHARVDTGGILVSVTDTGAGMDAAALAHAFEPYFSTKTSGTGLGLPIAKRNVELNGGTIAIESQSGRGTTVILRLPIYRPLESLASAAASSPSPASS